MLCPLSPSASGREYDMEKFPARLHIHCAVIEVEIAKNKVVEAEGH